MIPNGNQIKGFRGSKTPNPHSNYTSLNGIRRRTLPSFGFNYLGESIVFDAFVGFIEFVELPASPVSIVSCLLPVASCQLSVAGGRWHIN